MFIGFGESFAFGHPALKNMRVAIAIRRPVLKSL
jgi:hypothetical protein